MFDDSTCEEIGYYVYLLQDPRNNEVFYVGKGSRNRVFQHVRHAQGLGDIEVRDTPERIRRILEIIQDGHQIQHIIIRHGLTELEAFHVEAAIIDLIDLIGGHNLTNLQLGMHAHDFGLLHAEELRLRYEAEQLITELPLILFHLNQLYRPNMTDEDLYNTTRGNWRISARRDDANYAIATYRGLTREVYEINNWYEVEVNGRIRWAFNGERVQDVNVRNELLGRRVIRIPGARSPFTYLNC